MARHLRSGTFTALHRKIVVDCLCNAGLSAQAAGSLATQIAQALIESAGGMKVYLPVRAAEVARRAERARALQAQGLCPGDIAGRLGVSVSQVYRLLRG